jgi:hypothetical protein
MAIEWTSLPGHKRGGKEALRRCSIVEISGPLSPICSGHGWMVYVPIMSGGFCYYCYDGQSIKEQVVVVAVAVVKVSEQKESSDHR